MERYIPEVIKEGHVEVLYKRGSEMEAEIFTKVFRRPKHSNFCCKKVYDNFDARLGVLYQQFKIVFWLGKFLD